MKGGSKLKFGFKQKVFRKRDNRLAIDALVIGTSVNAKGRPFLSEDIDRVFPLV
ncbi:hypothetical protein [Endozoicomonas sp. GU-1]|uniref:hypothetical protein n=1 Tax=Endozoicomonas sp. GU-1 TaxID=3009078 RepID=UPI0022B3D234|nr:hypothetical protein [Endozoicomonas sp. GU-1]WBA80828.1 hypothetical protein O2T12_21355 [Endozoicomonas sp. GU-1]WBA88389.1 hypothetical protein O3276_10535 [Endozoicomonas sp. GU-1]